MKRSILAVTAVLALPSAAIAQPAVARPEPEPPPQPAGTPQPVAPEPPGPEVPLALTVAGYVETYYQGHFQNPSNRITNLRGYDNRSRTFTIENAVLDIKGQTGPIATRVVLQVGHTGATYYLAEPFSLGTSSVDTSDGQLWKYLQAANVTAKLPADWLLEAGLFLSSIGYEVLPIKDNMQWSRSNLFFALPTYHTGAMLSHPVGDGWLVKLHVYNGWNSVVDNNGYPSVALSGAYAADRLTGQLMYFGGIERPSDAPEGTPWRNLFDGYLQYPVSDVLTLAGHVDGGFELNDFGTSWWIAGSLHVKYELTPQLYAAGRGDVFREGVASDASGTAGTMFFPTEWVAEGTATLAYQPVDHVSVRVEYRHDQAASDAYFGGDVAIDPLTLQFIPNREAQDTLLLGVVSWF